MDDALHTDDLDPAAVHTLDHLARLLRMVRAKANQPSLRQLEDRTRTRQGSTFLSRTAASEMLNGTRLPRKDVMVSFLKVCAVPDEALEPWIRAWERLAINQGPKARREAAQLTAENDELSQRLENSASASPQTPAAGDLRITGNATLQDLSIRYFAIEDDANSEQQFYGELTQYVQNAKQGVYVLSMGFHEELKSSVYNSLIQAEKEALHRGVSMVRIHTGDLVADSWAQGYAELLEEFPYKFNMMADLDGISYNDVILIDPHGREPVVSLLFESREQVELGVVGRPIAALIIKNARPFARNLAGHFYDHRRKGLEKLNSRNLRELASKYTYFAWGVHMAPSKIQRDVPDASFRGTAILRKWKRNIKAMLSGPADRATIKFTDNEQDAFDGVAYDLSWPGKARLDRLERRAYKEVDVTIKLDDGQLVPAFTYVPLPEATEGTRLADGSWIDLVVEGARERKMWDLVDELRDAGYPIGPNRI
jgi:hypothetical protein